ETDVVALDEERAVRAFEADEIDDVHRVRDEQRLLEPFLQPCQAIVHAFSFRYSRPSRYPSAPWPTKRVATRSRITEFFLHSSRSSTFERCTSTSGIVSGSSASWI